MIKEMLQVSFWIGGKNLTNLLRRFYKEDQDLYKNLVSCLPALSIEEANEIVNGKKKLIGDSRNNNIRVIYDANKMPSESTKYYWITPTSIEDSQSAMGWVSPKGEFFPCEYSEHNETADLLVKEFYGKYDIISDEFLLNRFWMKIGHKHIIYKGLIEDNQKLSDFLFDYFYKYNKDYLTNGMYEYYLERNGME